MRITEGEMNFVDSLLGIVCHFPMHLSSCSWPRERRSSSGVTAACAMSASMVVLFCCFRSSKRKGAVCVTGCKTGDVGCVHELQWKSKQRKSCPSLGPWVVLPWNLPLGENQAVVKQQLRVFFVFLNIPKIINAVTKHLQYQ